MTAIWALVDWVKGRFASGRLGQSLRAVCHSSRIPPCTYMSSKAKPIAVPRILLGSTPGLLDATQPERILRHPGSILSFANFNPLTATGRVDIPSGPPPQTFHPPTTSGWIVVETIPGGGIHWRAVPEADFAPGVNDEGVWPRLVSICG